ncbi:chemotaxis protein CheA [Paenalcaligenes faecalis]|uniref:chemotaxis protein CheA n=1 Tax=Paenalcaligenes faecalis TaxID=2980099 RepID=UPI0022B9B901|nr:chemotaxis protein CheA [Paenalcaligenes faecalis]
MSSGVDLSQFYDTFFDEADELLADMERLLLELDIDDPDGDMLNAIFRAAHSIKGGAATFGCFGHLADTTHLLENLLDFIRDGEMALRQDLIDLFLETKDILSDQVVAYRNGASPDEDTYQHICAQLRQIAKEHAEGTGAVKEAPVAVEPAPAAAPTPSSTSNDKLPLRLTVSNAADKDLDVLREEMALMGDILHEEKGDNSLSIWLETTASADDIEAVCCFVVNTDQLSIAYEAIPGQAPKTETIPKAPQVEAAPEPVVTAPPAVVDEPKAVAATNTTKKAAKPAAPSARSESSTLRVGVEKVDQIINLVGELVITQAMLVQTASTLDPVIHDRLLNGIEQLERNARDLQEAVMSIRMMPMDYVFSRFPRVVRENAARMEKEIRLVTRGAATELDKSLIERIIDPLTHLVRNSIDHGIEMPDQREAAGKKREGTLTLSAQHQGGHIVIEVIDDGGGLKRDKILKKALANGLTTNENLPDEELWQLLFAPGFSTAEQVTAISGRGVGMDVVRRNIQSMGGHVQMFSREGQGTTTRIVLPLTLAILDGMSVQVGEETFILPLSHVTESMQPTEEQMRNMTVEDRVMYVRGEYLPVVSLGDVFSVDGYEKDMKKAIAVVLQAEDMRFALIVDHLIGQHQVVVKNLEANYRKIPGISAATILGDGSVALIVDVFALHRLTRERSSLSTATLN